MRNIMYTDRYKYIYKFQIIVTCYKEKFCLPFKKSKFNTGIYLVTL